MGVETKAAVSVAEMARMVGLSRARFYQLIGTAFPAPLYDVQTRRPHYDELLQNTCLEVRRRNCGIDGKPILFYARRNSTSPPAKKTAMPNPFGRKLVVNPEIIQGLKSLGITSVNESQTTAVIGKLFPQGIDGIDQGEVIRSIFIQLMRQNSNDNVAR